MKLAAAGGARNSAILSPGPHVPTAVSFATQHAPIRAQKNEKMNTTRLRDHLLRWVDNAALARMVSPDEPQRIDWVRTIPFVILHVACLAVFLVGWSPVAVGMALVLYLVRMFAITAFYHRYFSHRTFRAGRAAQFLMAVAGASSGQRGPLWWAAHHRKHHRFSDKEPDVHSPVQHGFWWSHMFWITTRPNFLTDYSVVKDLARYPELRWLDRFDKVVPLAVAALMFGLGALLERVAPGLGTNGPQMLVWFLISTIVLFHCTCFINSLAHLLGSRRYRTGDESRNSLLLALITLGEGWHNNHHHYPASARQGFYWYEVDPTWWGLWLLARLRLIRDLRPVPVHVREDATKRIQP